MDIQYVIFFAILLSFILVHVNQRLASPVIAIADRWLRWIIFPIVGAWLCLHFEIIDRPMWAIAAAGFLVWFLVETLYNWLAIAALSVSPFPLFPRYALNISGEEWPVQPRFLKIREWLRAQGFRQIQALKAEVGGDIFLRVSVYQDEAALLRILVTFLPRIRGDRRLLFADVDDAGRLEVRHRQPLYSVWRLLPRVLVRRPVPCCRSLPRLLALHRGGSRPWGGPSWHSRSSPWPT